MRLVWGPEGVNVEKMAEEGHPSACQLLWGLYMNFDTLEVTLPEPKRIKAKYLLGEPSLHRGCASVPAKLLRELAGCAQYWAVCPELRPHLATMYALLKGAPGGKGEWAAPAVDADPQVAWTEFWDTLDFIRERPVASSFRAAFQKLLPIRELLALPGTTERTKVVGGDATPERLGAVDWDGRRFMVEDTSQFVEAFRSLAEASDHVEIIAIMELLAFLVFASQESANWSGLLVFYVTDNQNVETWLKRRRPRNRVARRLVLLLQRLEAERGFLAIPPALGRTVMSWPTGLAEPPRTQ